MHGEVFRHMKDCRQRGYFRSLDLEFVQKPVGIEDCERFVHGYDCCPEPGKQFIARDGRSFIKLSLAHTSVSFPSKARDNPLASISRKVQQKIANAVGFWI